MNPKIRALSLVLIMLVNLFGPEPIQSQTSGSGRFTLVNLAPAWTTGILSDGVGPAKIVVADLDQDSRNEIVTCSNGHVYALNHTLSGSYDTIWFSEYIGCEKVTSADRDSNGVRELYVATNDRRIVIFNGGNYQVLDVFSLPYGPATNDIEVADVDSDGVQEIILARLDATLVYDASTYELEWQATDMGGTQLAAGNIDNDAQVEVVVNGSPAHILDASQKTQKWSYSEGFGVDMGVGDVDGDNRAEIAYIEAWYFLSVFDGDSRTIKWQRDDFFDLDEVAIADVDGNGISEVLVGNPHLSGVSAYQGSDGTKLWDIKSVDRGVFGIGIGDANNDSVNEILWGAGLATTGRDTLVVGSWKSQTVEWSSNDLDGPLYVQAGDVDDDGQGEIVMASRSTRSWQEGGTVRIYDGVTHQLEWSNTTSDPSRRLDVYQLAIGQLDSDAALEILVGGEDLDARLHVYDGIKQTIEWESPILDRNHARAITVMNLDEDTVDEIVVGLRQQVLILNGASSIVEWDSGVLEGEVQDLAVGDLDGDKTLDLAVLTSHALEIYEVGTWIQELHQELTGGRQLVIGNADLTGAGELLLITTDSDSGNTTLRSFDGNTYTAKWELSLDNADIQNLDVADLDSDGIQEFIVMGNTTKDWTSPSFLGIGYLEYPHLWEYQMDGYWGTINGMALSDVDDDGRMEFLLGSSHLIQVNEIITSSEVIEQTYFPLVAKSKSSRNFYGTVTVNGLPAEDIPLDLRFYNGDYWSTFASTTTASDGSYAFADVPSVSPGQFYYVRYQNTADGNPNYLWTWHTQMVSPTTYWSEFKIGDFDIADIRLLSPSHGSTVHLPYTFKWVTRPATPWDTYEFNLYDPFELSPYFFTDPPLGYVGEYVLNSLPPGFNVGDQYAWDIWVYSGDGGYGVSYQAKGVKFYNTGLDVTKASQPNQTKNLPDLEDLLRRSY
jgi:hypothetical protein